MISRLTSARALLAFTIFSAVLIACCLFIVSSRVDALERHTDQLAARQQEVSRIQARIDAKERQLAKGRRLEISLMQPEQVILDEADDFIGQINQWTRKVGSLMSYVDTNPQLIIPEMHLLDDWDWYSATRGVTLESEADYRKVLAHLRATAKNKVSAKVHEALQKYLKESGGEPPKDAADLLPYIDSPEVEALVLRLAPPANDDSGAARNNKTLSEGVSVDSLWDSALFLTERGIGMQYKAPPDLPMRDAIALYREEHGSPPTSVEDIRPFYSPPEWAKQFPEDQLPELFKALMTSFDPTGN